VSADWVMTYRSDATSAEGTWPGRNARWMVTGRSMLTGAATHSPRTVTFAFSPGSYCLEDRWRLTIDGTLVWIENPGSILRDFDTGTPRRYPRNDERAGPPPAREVRSLRSLREATQGWLDVPTPTRPVRRDDSQERPLLVYEVTSPRACRFVVDEETGFVVSLTATGPRGQRAVIVEGFTVEPLDPTLFEYPSQPTCIANC
jgi:hypothetical protein